MLNYYFDKDDSVGKFLKLIFIKKDRNIKQYMFRYVIDEIKYLNDIYYNNPNTLELMNDTSKNWDMIVPYINHCKTLLSPNLKEKAVMYLYD